MAMNVAGDAWDATKTIAGAALLGFAKPIGKAAFKIGAALMDGVGKAGFSAAKMTGKGSFKAAETIGKGAYYSLNETRGVTNPVGFMAKMGKSAVSTFSKGPLAMGKSEMATYGVNRFTGQTRMNPGGLKLTYLGTGTLLGTGAIMGAQDAERQYRSDRIGPVDPQTRTATPDITPQEYRRGVDDAGATGDLVFALHNNRRG